MVGRARIVCHLPLIDWQAERLTYKAEFAFRFQLLVDPVSFPQSRRGHRLRLQRRRNCQGQVIAIAAGVTHLIGIVAGGEG